jgi:hypothetical protein
MRRKLTGDEVTVRDALDFYLEDIEQICELLEGGCDNITLETEDHVLDTPKELIDLRKESIQQLHIHGVTYKGPGNIAYPALQVSIGPWETWVKSFSDEPSHIVMVTQLAQLIRKVRRSRWRNLVLSPPTHTFLLLAVLLAAASGLLGPAIVSRILLVIFSALYLARFLYKWDLRVNRVILRYSTDTEPSVLRRYRDEVIIVVITFIVTLLLQYLWTSLFPPGAP